MVRRSRGRRRTTRAITLTDRDQVLLGCVALMRYLAADQLAREFFPSEDRCRRRLRQLFDANLLRVTLVGSTSPNIVSLTSDGLRLVAQANPSLAATLHLAGPIKASAIAHHLGIVDVRFYLAALTRTGGVELTRWMNTETLRLGGDGSRLVPDAVAELAVQGGSHRLAVELDLGGETLAVIEHKCRRYAVAVEQRSVDEIWFVVKLGGTRAESIRRLVRAAGIGEVTRVLTLGHVNIRPVQPPPARVAEQERLEEPISVRARRQFSSSYPTVAEQEPNADRWADSTADRWGR